MIIALKHNEEVKVIFDASELHVIGLSESDLDWEGNRPYWRTDQTEHVIVYSTMSVFCSDLFRYQSIIKYPLTLKSLQMETVPALVDILEEFGCLEEKGAFESDILVLSQNEIFSIDRYRLVTRHEQFCVIDYHRLMIEESLEMIWGLSLEEQIHQVMDLRYHYIKRYLRPYFILDVRTGQVNRLFSKQE